MQAANVIAETTIDLVGAIGRRVLNTLMPARRLRVSPRAVNRPLSRYAYKSLRIDRKSYQATLSIDILAGQPRSTNVTIPNFTVLVQRPLVRCPRRTTGRRTDRRHWTTWVLLRCSSVFGAAWSGVRGCVRGNADQSGS